MPRYSRSVAFMLESKKYVGVSSVIVRPKLFSSLRVQGIEGNPAFRNTGPGGVPTAGPFSDGISSARPHGLGPPALTQSLL